MILLTKLHSFMGTVLNVLQNTPRKRLLEVIILDDKGEPPVTWNPDPERVRIVRSSEDCVSLLEVDERLGLIRARITGGNAARGDFIVFLDAHCRVSPRWLETPHRLLMEVGMCAGSDTCRTTRRLSTSSILS